MNKNLLLLTICILVFNFTIVLSTIHKNVKAEHNNLFYKACKTEMVEYPNAAIYRSFKSKNIRLYSLTNVSVNTDDVENMLVSFDYELSENVQTNVIKLTKYRMKNAKVIY